MANPSAKDSTRLVYICIHVSEYKSVRLTLDAYNRLERQKRDDESFSEAVERLAADRPIRELAGVFSDVDVDAIREAREESYDAYADDRESGRNE